MTDDLKRAIDELEDMSVPVLFERYAAVVGYPTRSGHRQWPVRRIAWRPQARAERGLSERARRRDAELLRALRRERALVYKELGQRRRERSELEKLYAEDPEYEDVAARLGL
ncbi:MAG: DUF2924 domain-containing protein [Deltaproteobacteria bacterium]|nr:MAG: DUF2924 domain-containing protein [Deltaproteobacteria bacterium]